MKKPAAGGKKNCPIGVLFATNPPLLYVNLEQGGGFVVRNSIDPRDDASRIRFASFFDATKAYLASRKISIFQTVKSVFENQLRFRTPCFATVLPGHYIICIRTYYCLFEA